MHRFIRPRIFSDSVNAFFTGKDPGADLAAIGSHLHLDPGRIYLPIQQHTDRVVRIDYDMEPKVADAVMTDRRDIVIGVRVADCVPVLIHDPVRHVVAAVHAGWRGTAAAILQKTIRRLSDDFACDPAHLVVAIGPSIGACCYEVDHEVAAAVRRATGAEGYITGRGEKFHLDLRAANRLQALSLGVPPAAIEVVADCTCCNPERFYSYRFSRVSAGRQGGFIGMSAS